MITGEIKTIAKPKRHSFTGGYQNEKGVSPETIVNKNDKKIESK